jgi:ABC-type sugar transport system substrate-binding protein
MQMIARGRSVLAFVAALLAMALPSAAQYSEVVKGACKNDYKRFCSVYALDDPGLRKCMDKAGPSLSQRCVAALVNSGEVSYQRATQRWGHKLEKVQ